MMKNKFNKILGLFLCAAMTVSLAACGKKDGAASSDAGKDYVYVPEYITLNGEDENSYFGNLIIKEDTLYYTKSTWDEETMASSEVLCEYSIADGSVKEILLSSSENSNISNYTLDGEGNIYTVVDDYSAERVNEEGYSIADTLVQKRDAQGKVLFEKDITKTVEGAGEYIYVQDIAVDGKGRIYVCLESGVVLLNSEGEEQGLVEIASGWINGIGLGKDDNVYVGYYDQMSADGGMAFSEIDFDGKKLGKSYHNVPNMNGRMSVGVEKDFLLNDGAKVYEYELSTESYEELFSWVECDINGSYVNYVAVAENGNLVAVVNDWESGKTELVKLKKTEASEVVQKEEIVIGVLYESQDLQAAAVNFNKANDTYHITIKTYIDTNNWTETSYQDAITNINNDLTSGTNCPDILELSQLNIKQLASKGVFEDLTPYLEKSTLFGKEDFVDNLLDGFTYDGVLVAIPSSFSLSTVVGKSSLVGTEMGWSLEDMIVLAEAHPDAQLFDGVMQAVMLQYCMIFNEDTFVNWSKGECHFDSDEFKSVLKFVGMFPEEIDWTAYDGGMNIEDRQNNKILLDPVGIYDFYEVQMYPEMFGEEVTFVGFPTTDESVGCMLSADSLYGVTSKSKCKDGAWAFIESYLANADSMYSWGFPAMKDKLQERIAEVTKVEYLLDENGEQILDENGEPILLNDKHSVNYDGWEYTYHIPTDDEVAFVKELISVAKPVSFTGSDEIMTIITEEAEAYFKGQKSLDEVCDIIQSRAQIYISENS